MPVRMGVTSSSNLKDIVDPERATVEPEARAALLSFDELARNYELAYSNV